MEAHIKAITANVAAKQTLVELCDAVAASAEIEAASTQRASNSKLAQASALRAEAITAFTEAKAATAQAMANQQVLTDARARVVAAEQKLLASQTAANTAQQQAASKGQEADHSQKEAKKSQEEADAAQKKAVAAKEKAVSALADSKLLTAALLPLKRSLSHATPDLEMSAAGSSSGMNGLQKRADGSPTQTVVLVESNSLEDVIAQMQLNSSPAIYDFQGKEVVCTTKSGSRTIPHNITLRNGRIVLGSSAYLLVASPGVAFESITLLGGSSGVWVQSGGNLAMTACEIRDCNTGVLMLGNGLLTASNLKLMDCKAGGIQLVGSSKAELLGGEISCDTSIYLSDNSSMVGIAVQITGMSSGLVTVHQNAKLRLLGCNITVKDGAVPGCVSSGVMASCIVNGKLV